VVYKGEDGQWIAECLSLPGCVSQGQTREEAVNQIREAIRLYIAVLEEDHLPIPEERFWLLFEQASSYFRPRLRTIPTAWAREGESLRNWRQSNLPLAASTGVYSGKAKLYRTPAVDTATYCFPSTE
jgi:predicted RNase H-like HicB family nuclease